MKPSLPPLFLLCLFALSGQAQNAPVDTVVIPLAESSKIIFTVGDPADLEILRHYDYEALFNDVLLKLEESHGITRDSAARASVPVPSVADDARQAGDDRRAAGEDEDNDENNGDDEDNGHDDERKWDKSRRGRIGQTWQSYNIDLGTNNYLADDQFPGGEESYAVRPWGSWYVGLNSVQRTRLGKNFFVEWAMGVSWYSFKFQEDNILMRSDELGVHFDVDNRDVDYIKSKLSATFINASLVPVLDFSDDSRKHRVWDGSDGGFRFGVGPYVGYRIASKSKLVYETNDDREREKERDDFYLNNLRYGFRLQLGVRSTDLFVNYDLNELFADGKGPRLNAVSFGLVF